MVVPWPRNGPSFSSSPAGLPRLKVCCHSKPSRRMVATSLLRQGVDHRRADAVQAAGVDVAVAVAELAAGVQRGQDQFQRRLLVLGVHVDGDAAAVVGDGDGVAGLVQRDGDGVGVAVEVFVDGVIDDFPDEVVQPLAVDAADVHRRPLADGLQAFEDGDVGGGVIAGWRHGAHAITRHRRIWQQMSIRRRSHRTVRSRPAQRYAPARRSAHQSSDVARAHRLARSPRSEASLARRPSRRRRSPRLDRHRACLAQSQSSRPRRPSRRCPTVLRHSDRSFAGRIDVAKSQHDPSESRQLSRLQAAIRRIGSIAAIGLG